jgi:hypothetical protein
LFVILIFASRQKILKKEKPVNTYEAVDTWLHLFLTSAAGKKRTVLSVTPTHILPRKKTPPPPPVKIGWEDVWAKGNGRAGQNIGRK